MKVGETRLSHRSATPSLRFPWSANQSLSRGMMRLRCMSTSNIAAEPSGTTANGANLSPTYGFGPPATIWRNRGAEHRQPRKCLGANGLRRIILVRSRLHTLPQVRHRFQLAAAGCQAVPADRQEHRNALVPAGLTSAPPPRRVATPTGTPDSSGRRAIGTGAAG
jgi:hypothetical protein